METVQYRPMPEYAEILTIEDFRKFCKALAFVNDDGVGYYSTETEISSIQARPSDFYYCTEPTIPSTLTHVAWFNK